MAVITLVSISTTLSSQPALRAISNAEFETVERNRVMSLIAFGSVILPETWNDYTQFAFAAKH